MGRANPDLKRGDRAAADGALKARMRRCLILRQGASPLRPPAPFPWFSIVRSEEELSRVRFAGAVAPPLTVLPHSQHRPIMRERGPLSGGPSLPPVGRRRRIQTMPEDGALRAHEALPHTPPGGQSPPETPTSWDLTETGLLMEAATVRRREEKQNGRRSTQINADKSITLFILFYRRSSAFIGGQILSQPLRERPCPNARLNAFPAGEASYFSGSSTVRN